MVFEPSRFYISTVSYIMFNKVVRRASILNLNAIAVYCSSLKLYVASL